jgi:hypothetical protein
MSEKYLIGEWVAFIQQIQHLVARGYTEYCLVNYPQNKTDKFLKIDQKLIKKYNANLNKDRAYYNKKKKRCNFKLLRYGDTAIIMKTKGDPREDIVMDDVFSNVQKVKINIKIGEKTILLIGYDEEKKTTVFLHNESYLNVKATCFQLLDSKNYYVAISTFNNLNGLPAWGGLVKQKIKMKGQIVTKMKKNLSADQVAVFEKKMIINTKRTPVKVF